MIQLIKISMCLSLALILAGCRIGGSTSVDKVTNELRAENSVLRKENQALKKENAELSNKLTPSTSADSQTQLTQEQLQALPRCAEIKLDSLSGIVPRTSNVYLYLKTLDGRSRFVQVVGTLTYKVTKGESHFEMTLPPTMLRDTYRSGLGGTYYLLDCGTRSLSDLAGATVEVQFEDALTKKTFTYKSTFDERGRIVSE